MSEKPFCWVRVNKHGDITRTVMRADSWCPTPLYTRPASTSASAAVVRGEIPGHGYPDWPTDLQTFGERAAYQRGVADARRIASEELERLHDIARCYEELRRIIDGGSESMTHEDAVLALKEKMQ